MRNTPACSKIGSGHVGALQVLPRYRDSDNIPGKAVNTKEWTSSSSFGRTCMRLQVYQIPINDSDRLSRVPYLNLAKVLSLVTNAASHTVQIDELQLSMSLFFL